METLRNYELLTDKELSEMVKKLGDTLEMMNPCDNDWDMIYKKYCHITAIQDERYREANQADFDAFYEKNIKGKKWEEIEPSVLDFYSDWYKDMYGFRPRR